MKKIAMVFAGLIASGTAIGAPVTFTQSGDYTMDNCLNADGLSLLTQDITITLSTGVVAGVDCVVNTLDNSKHIAVATCHSSGVTANRTADHDNDVNTAPTAVTGAAYPAASTRAGTVQNSYPDSGDCSSANAGTVATDVATNW